LVCTGLPSLMLLASGVMKFVGGQPVAEGFAKFGWPMSLLPILGTLELGCLALYLIPRTSVLGAILLTGYLGGATATHVRIGDPWFAPVILGIALWGGLWFREPRLRALLPLR
jgi:hypothetical protein